MMQYWLMKAVWGLLHRCERRFFIRKKSGSLISEYEKKEKRRQRSPGGLILSFEWIDLRVVNFDEVNGLY